MCSNLVDIEYKYSQRSISSLTMSPSLCWECPAPLPCLEDPHPVSKAQLSHLLVWKVPQPDSPTLTTCRVPPRPSCKPLDSPRLGAPDIGSLEILGKEALSNVRFPLPELPAPPVCMTCHPLLQCLQGLRTVVTIYPFVEQFPCAQYIISMLQTLM